ncbi:hypothetical protein [Richelia sinica]|nr:hypothetical protein [Richelia sinica]MBD2664382.1 hypothetical protein [Richelia sinica FACHB-800]
MAYWVKVQHQRKEYVINLEYVHTFCYEPNGRITFWVPNSNLPMTISPQSNWEDYQKILEYLECVQGLQLDHAYWVTIAYDRNKYIINLKCISSFCYEPNGRLTFWLPEMANPIIINPVSSPESYTQIVHYLEKTTGYYLS